MAEMPFSSPSIPFPLLPERLSYPELFGPGADPNAEDFFYDGTLEGLSTRLRALIDRVVGGELWRDEPTARRLVEPFYWTNLAPRLDNAAERVANQG